MRAGRPVETRAGIGGEKVMIDSVQKRVSDLVAFWEDKRRQGVKISLEELCRHAPELLPEVAKQIQGVQKLDRRPVADQETLGGARKSFSGDAAFPFLSPPQQPGEIGRLANYRILKLLGKGGM